MSKVIEISYGNSVVNQCCKPTVIRKGCRGIVVKDGKVLLSHELNSKQYLIPGGGLEEVENGLVPDWVDFDEALKFYSEYEKYKETNICKYGTYCREYTALKEYRND